ncbi:hypothetical protein UNDYM_4099 [Undibacterium sp. YM2]|uniref:hypothetical protein n=1 Tax=Undibacterium sp. YM2 TaxID=2058625 RepID=UPI001331EF27|nr:hypothetical protein [Undibacterium sp. YM2]BBB68352.1 hypothetical protein UNDYM_4099 [Undibacterium sp. YM2]
MPFTYEYMPEGTFQKYHLNTMEKEFLTPGSSRWVVDKERDIHLRYMTREREEPTETKFSFYWEGKFFKVILKSTAHSGKRGGEGSVTWDLLKFYEISPKVMNVTEVYGMGIISDLKDAIRTYKDGTLPSVFTEFTTYFEF